MFIFCVAALAASLVLNSRLYKETVLPAIILFSFFLTQRLVLPPVSTVQEYILSFALTSIVSRRDLRCRSTAPAKPRRCGYGPLSVLPPAFRCLPLASIGFCYVPFSSLIFYRFPYVSICNRIDSCSYFA